MYSNFDVENFPPEAVALLRLLGENTQSVSVEQMEHQLDLSERSLGRAIRRLVSYHLIQLDYNGAYQLTSRGRTIYTQMPPSEATSSQPLAGQPTASGLSFDSENSAMAAYAAGSAQASTMPIPTIADPHTPITRRLTFVVQPSTADSGLQPITLLVGVNAPAAESQTAPIGSPVSIALQLTATGCTLSRSSLALDVPIDKATKPESFAATIDSGAKAARIRADVYQLDDFGDATVIAATYFDLPVRNALTAPRAFGITLSLR